MKTIEINVYTYEELSELGNSTAVLKANNTIASYMEDDIYEIDWYDFKDTMQALAEVLVTDITEYTFQLFGGQKNMVFDAEAFGDNDNYTKNAIVKELNNYAKWRNAEYTGVYTDYYVYDYLTKHYPNGVTYNDLTNIVKHAPNYILHKYAEDSEESVQDTSYYSEYANMQDFHFTKEGKLYL